MMARIVNHDSEFDALVSRVKSLPRLAKPSSPWRDYVALTAVVLCLLIFDTETWLQRLLLLVLGVTAALILFCLRVEWPARK